MRSDVKFERSVLLSSEAELVFFVDGKVKEETKAKSFLFWYNLFSIAFFGCLKTK